MEQFRKKIEDQIAKLQRQKQGYEEWKVLSGEESTYPRPLNWRFHFYKVLIGQTVKEIEFLTDLLNNLTNPTQ